ncbi:hypothetical protein AAA799E16_01714 [Marine Group I thaumarchaeote SCGC AAA799-E16]|uniref:Uncharacterized protein n=4 Tax=Marine Group I TaxID=905826 RepID=A0A081RMU9_9ARCH|nr:hypothetical protein AAA799N04_01014 [Marine Group I thaumarchaeote SCGC AAA799-N04]KER05638.1 hypothetical protein AAA799E16_01714 [Marine Group I thaumarchaeote SCGC AAA799-E16]KFM15575.1 hypothetical protein AAA799D11_01180 [Marine Group I thaumarchaeote SCGC AAA799-D11]KFM16775.1 hypothetical protein SCCGRSA3_02092 [Marine Group I thaumarchaeote SCGC RSA3]
MKNYRQTYRNFKLQKLFDTCKLEGRWKRMDDSLPRCYVSLEDGTAISLSILGTNYSESFIFKKNSKIVVKDSVAEFFEDDLLR